MDLTTENSMYDRDGKEQYKTIESREIIISAKGMNKIEFDEFMILFSTGLELQGWTKSFSGYNLKGDFEVRFVDVLGALAFT